MQWFYDETVQFQLWGEIHLVTIALCISVLLCLYLFRFQMKKIRDRLRVTIAALLVLSRISLDFWYVITGNWDVRFSLPLELCSIASLACALMLLTKSKFLFEACYFIGIAGAIQAIVTPELMLGFPQYRYIQFFLDHFLLITGPLLMIWLYDYTITKRSLVRAFVIINSIALIVFFINKSIGANYMFLMHKPTTASLFDFLGPYPFYLFVLEIITLFCFTLLLLPFTRKKRREIRQ